MSEVFVTCSPTTSVAPSSSTPSLASVFGPMPSEWLGGLMTDLYGLDRVRASLSRPPDVGVVSTTSGTCGLRGLPSSTSANLQSSLESRLRVLTASSGSTLFRLTWKESVTPSGRRFCLLRASVPRTSDIGRTSWPSPVTNDAKGSAYTYSNGDHASWPTTTTRDWKDGTDSTTPVNGYLGRAVHLTDTGPTPSGFRAAFGMCPCTRQRSLSRSITTPGDVRTRPSTSTACTEAGGGHWLASPRGFRRQSRAP